MSGSVLIAPLFLAALAGSAYSQTAITHQISLPAGESWCSDSMINDLFGRINSLRSQNGLPALTRDAVGMKDAELRATQVIDYFATHQFGSNDFFPHQGYDTTAASLGYNIQGENLAWITSDPAYIMGVVWQDTLHLNAMLTTSANVAGVSCVYSSGGTPFWTYEPGFSSSPTPPPSGGLDSEELAFLTLINQFRAQNGVGPLQVSAALQAASLWMSNDMGTHNLMDHTDSLGRSVPVRLTAFGYPFSPWGENIAGGYTDAQSVFNAWSTACDPGPSGVCTYSHRQNMLSANFNVIGIGRVSVAGSAFGWYWTTDFGGVVDQTINTGSGQAPVINSFTATPTSITAGQAATLSWNVTGATTLSINGTNVSGSSMTVTPSQTTSYTLTATNTAGSVTAQAVVSVSTAVDTQPPSAPTLTTAAAKSATEVDLVWTASTDNVGVTGYQIIRNGVALSSVTGNTLGFADTSVSPNTTYTYSIKAFDAAGNYSLASNILQATTSAAPPATTCPGPAVGAFTGCYYNNTDLSGNPVLARSDSQINFRWGSASPAAGITPQNFSVRWQGMFAFDAGSYTFTLTMSDGYRFYIDGVPVRSAWRDEGPSLYLVPQTLSQGNHLITVEYYEHTGTATAVLSWQSPTSVIGSAPVINSFSATPTAVAAGQPSTLSWNVTGATAVSINGTNVSGSSMTVTPSQTTTYTLTAANSAGSATAQAVVTVSSAVDTQPPSVPALTTAAPKSATEVDLVWTASTDNVGVAGYQITRNGIALSSVNGNTLGFADTNVSANTTYTYSIKAFDAAGNYSLASNILQATTPTAAPSTTCPGPAVGAFTGCYYNNTDLSGNPALVRNDSLINFNWGSASPAGGITPQNFSVRWQGMFAFDAGSYAFTLNMSDGYRFYIDGVPVRSAWRDESPSLFLFSQTLSQGNHLITVEYYEHTGTATAVVSWRKN